MKMSLPPEAVKAYETALAEYAKEVIMARLYTATEAIKEFGITRHSLTKIQPTYDEGKARPSYSAKAILRYLANREGKPR